MTNNNDYDLYAQLEAELYSQLEDVPIESIISKPETPPVELKVNKKQPRKPLGVK